MASVVVTDEEKQSLLQNHDAEKESKSLRILQISVRGENFKNLDGLRDKSDSQCTLLMKWKRDQREWQEIDHTEVKHDDLSPAFVHHFNVIFNFGQKCLLKFMVHDVDSNGKK